MLPLMHWLHLPPLLPLPLFVITTSITCRSSCVDRMDRLLLLRVAALLILRRGESFCYLFCLFNISSVDFSQYIYKSHVSYCSPVCLFYLLLPYHLVRPIIQVSSPLIYCSLCLSTCTFILPPVHLKHLNKYDLPLFTCLFICLS